MAMTDVQKAVERLRGHLDGIGLAPEQVDKLVGNYQDLLEGGPVAMVNQLSNVKAAARAFGWTGLLPCLTHMIESISRAYGFENKE